MKVRRAILGVGIVNGRGRGLACQLGPAGDPESGAPPAGRTVLRVAGETLNDRTALRKLRRADRFCKLSALAAWDAAAEAGWPSAPGDAGLGIIVTTAFGPHRTTFDFLDDILDFGDAAVSPTKFSHSVHNAAAAYIGIMLASQGPTTSVTDFQRPFQAGLRLAALWLAEDRCARVLVGYTEEWAGPLETILGPEHCGQMALPPVPPLNLSPDPEREIGEGSLFLAIGRSSSGGVAFDPERFDGTRPVADLDALLQCLGRPGVRHQNRAVTPPPK